MSSNFSELMQIQLLDALIRKHDLLNKVTANSEMSTKYTGTAMQGNLNVTITEVPKQFIPELTTTVSNLIQQEYPKLLNKKVVTDMIVNRLKGKPIESMSSSTAQSLAGTIRDNISKKGTKIRGTKGQFVSPITLRDILEKATILQLTKNMQAPGAPLVYRTGRFANSIQIHKINEWGEDSLEIGYSYMKRPYSVFDPEVSTYRGLSLRPTYGARNPRKLIREAIVSAIKDLVSARYKIRARLL